MEKKSKSPWYKKFLFPVMLLGLLNCTSFSGKKNIKSIENLNPYFSILDNDYNKKLDPKCKFEKSNFSNLNKIECKFKNSDTKKINFYGLDLPKVDVDKYVFYYDENNLDPTEEIIIFSKSYKMNLFNGDFTVDRMSLNKNGYVLFLNENYNNFVKFGGNKIYGVSNISFEGQNIIFNFNNKNENKLNFRNYFDNENIAYSNQINQIIFNQKNKNILYTFNQKNKNKYLKINNYNYLPREIILNKHNELLSILNQGFINKDFNTNKINFYQNRYEFVYNNSNDDNYKSIVFYKKGGKEIVDLGISKYEDINPNEYNLRCLNKSKNIYNNVFGDVFRKNIIGGVKNEFFQFQSTYIMRYNHEYRYITISEESCKNIDEYFYGVKDKDNVPYFYHSLLHEFFHNYDLENKIYEKLLVDKDLEIEESIIKFYKNSNNKGKYNFLRKYAYSKNQKDKRLDEFVPELFSYYLLVDNSEFDDSQKQIFDNIIKKYPDLVRYKDNLRKIDKNFSYKK